MSNLRITDDAAVRRITFNRPAKLNAWLPDDIAAATAAVQTIPPATRAIVFRGAGERAFSVGVDVGTFLGLSSAGARAFITLLRDFLAAARTAPVPTLCAINGYCLGGAMELAMAADIRIAAQQAQFGMPEIKVGIPSVLDAALLPQHIGLSKAKELLLTGDLYGAAELDRHGFLNRVVPLADLDGAVDAMLARLTPHSATALRAQKGLFETWQNVSLEEAIAASVDAFAAVFGAEETADRLAAYAAQLRARSGDTNS